MPETTSLQQQRELLRTFRQASARRAEAKADADARLKSELERAGTALDDARKEARLQRERAESHATTRLEKARGTAATAQDQAKQQADAQLDEVHNVVRLARSRLAGVGLAHQLDQTPPAAPSRAEIALPGLSSEVNPSQELANRMATINEIVREIQTSVEALIRQRDERRFQLYVLGGLAAVLAILALVFLNTSGTGVVVILMIVWTLWVILLHEWGILGACSQKSRILLQHPLMQRMRSMAAANDSIRRFQTRVDEWQQDERRFQFQVAGGLTAILAILIPIFLITGNISIFFILAFAWAVFLVLLRAWDILGALMEGLSNVDYSVLLSETWSKVVRYWGIMAHRVGALARRLIRQTQSRVTRLMQNRAKSDDSK